MAAAQRTFDEILFDSGQEVATPVYIFEMTAGPSGLPGVGYVNKDFGFEQQHNEQRNELTRSASMLTGRSPTASASDSMRTIRNAESLPNDDITGGSQTAFSLAGVPLCAGTGDALTNIAGSAGNCAGFTAQQYDFSGDLPVATRLIYANQAAAEARLNGNPNYIFDGNHLGSQVMRINFQQVRHEIKQYRLDGKFELNDNNRFSFGVETARHGLAPAFVQQPDDHGQLGRGGCGHGERRQPGFHPDAVQPRGHVR